MSSTAEPRELTHARAQRRRGDDPDAGRCLVAHAARIVAREGFQSRLDRRQLRLEPQCQRAKAGVTTAAILAGPPYGGKPGPATVAIIRVGQACTTMRLSTVAYCFQKPPVL